jgi:hypothetical protein
MTTIRKSMTISIWCLSTTTINQLYVAGRWSDYIQSTNENAVFFSLPFNSFMSIHTVVERKKECSYAIYKHVHHSVAKNKESTIGVSKILKSVVFRSWKLQLIILFCSHRRWLYRSSAIEHSSYRLLVLFSSILDDISVDLFTLVNCFLCALLCENLTFLFFFLLYNHSNSLMSTFMTFYSSYFN